jgi:hypothetical protein
MLIVLVQTPLVHSVDVSVTVVHAAPNEPAAGPSAAASTAAVVPELHAMSALAQMQKTRRITICNSSA